MFKLNDKVKIVNTDYASDELANGQTGVVDYTQITGGSPVIGVLLDNGFTPSDVIPGTGKAWAFYPNQLELAE